MQGRGREAAQGLPLRARRHHDRRFGEWSYYNTDHAILAGKRAAEAVKALRERSRQQPAGAAVSAALSRQRSEEGAALTATGKI